MLGPRARQSDTTRRELNRVVAHHAYAHGHGRARHKPIQVFMQVASGCNLDCYMCSEHNRPVEARHGRDLTSLSRELYDKIAAEIFPLSSTVYIGVGGEPMLAPQFNYFVERAWELGQRVHVMTNGTRIDRPEMAELFARCVAYLQISIDGATPATYERIRRGAKFARMQKNLTLLNEQRLRYPKDERTKLCLCFVLMKSNVHELPLFVEMAARFEAEEVHAHHVIPVTEEGKAEALIDEPERWNEIRAIALERARELGVELDVPKPFPVGAAAAANVPVATLEPLPLPHVAPFDAVSAGSADFAILPADSVHTPSSAHAARNSPSGNGAAVSTERSNVMQVPSNGAPHAPHESHESHEPLARAMAPRPPAIACHMPTLETFIFYDGRVFPCCHPYAHEKMQVGDLRTQSFEEIWNGPLYRHLRAGLRTGDVPPICELCSIVHDPPPGPEDPDVIRRGEDLATRYAGRDLAGSAESPNGASALLLDLEETGIVAHVEDLMRHSATIERERDALRGHASNLERIISKTGAMWTFRVLGGVKGFFFPKKPV
jgi:MoaA/NifB/PqqE/SkfB family radical SAM enzyme